jgi:hypothetical protein
MLRLGLSLPSTHYLYLPRWKTDCLLGWDQGVRLLDAHRGTLDGAGP